MGTGFLMAAVQAAETNAPLTPATPPVGGRLLNPNPPSPGGISRAPSVSPAIQPPVAQSLPPVSAAEVTPRPMPILPSNSILPPDPDRKVGRVTFEGAPVAAVLEYYATQLAHRSIIAPPSIPGLIFFRSQTELTVEEAMEALETALALQAQIAIVPMGDKFMKVVPVNSAIQESIPFTPAGREQPSADRLSTQIIPLQYAEVADVMPFIAPYKHAYAQVFALPKANSILITETGNNINLMMRIIAAIDVPSPLQMETRVYVLVHAKAAEVVQRLQDIITQAQQLGASTAASAQQPGSAIRPPMIRPSLPGAVPSPSAIGAGPSEISLIEGKVIITPDERTNKLFIFSRPSNFAFFERLMAELDAKVEPDLIVKVIELNYQKAEDAAGEVNALITGGSYSPTRRSTSSTTSGGRPAATPPPPSAPAGAGGGASQGAAGMFQYAEGVKVLPDPRINSLIVMATKEDMVRIEQLIRQIDIQVAQVQIEVVIAEVKLDNELDVGVDVFKRMFQTGSVYQQVGNNTDGNTPANLTIPPATPFPALSGLSYFATFKNLKLDAVLHALSTTSRAKILSTPVIQTLNNEKADILVGESQPVPVSTVANLVSGIGTLSSSTALNSSIDYKDIAIELSVTPQINPGGYVRMDIAQKVNDLGGSVNIGGTTAPIITKREATSSVAVRDGSTIVLGGLIKENKIVAETKTPILGDIPFLGQLFKSKAITKTRDELIIFVRPTVMFTDEQAVIEARRRSRLMEGAGELDLEKQFKNTLTNAPSALPPKAPVPSDESQYRAQPAADASGSPESQRHAAKVRALQEQGSQPN